MTLNKQDTLFYKIIVLKIIEHRPSTETYFYVWTDRSLIYISEG